MMNGKLIVFPFGGGNRYSYHALRPNVSPKIEFIPVEFPGRGARMSEPLIDDSRALVDDLFERVKSLISPPYVFYGHCMGALISFLLIQRIVLENAPMPAHVFVSGCSGPSTFKRKAVSVLSDEEVREWLLRFNTPKELVDNSNFFEMMSPIVRADFKVLSEYVYEPHDPFKVPITVILEKSNRPSAEDGRSWQVETTFPVNVRHIAGSISDRAAEVAEILSKPLLAALYDSNTISEKGVSL